VGEEGGGPLQLNPTLKGTSQLDLESGVWDPYIWACPEFGELPVKLLLHKAIHKVGDLDEGPTIGIWLGERQ